MMPHLFIPLREAFNESANFLAWSFYAMITAYVSLALLEREAFKTRYNGVISKVLYVISMIIFIPNMYFVSQVFQEKLGALAGVISFILGLLMMMLNAFPVITGIVQKKKDL